MSAAVHFGGGASFAAASLVARASTDAQLSRRWSLAGGRLTEATVLCTLDRAHGELTARHFNIEGTTGPVQPSEGREDEQAAPVLCNVCHVSPLQNSARLRSVCASINSSSAAPAVDWSRRWPPFPSALQSCTAVPARRLPLGDSAICVPDPTSSVQRSFQSSQRACFDGRAQSRKAPCGEGSSQHSKTPRAHRPPVAWEPSAPNVHQPPQAVSPHHQEPALPTAQARVSAAARYATFRGALEQAGD